MFNKWITLFLFAFIVYAYLSQPNSDKHDPQQSEQVEKSENQSANQENFTVSEVIDLFKDDQNNSNENNKNQVDKQKDIFDSVPLNHNQPQVENNSNNRQIVITPDREMNFVERKIVNVLGNLVNSEKGQKLIDKIFTVDPKFAGPNKIINPYQNNTSSDLKIGNGYPIQCGQNVLAHYLIKKTNGDKLKDTSNSGPEILSIGAGKVIKGIEYAIIGMREGGVRRVILPSSLAVINSNPDAILIDKNDFLGVDIEIVKVKTSIPVLKNEIKIYNDNYGDIANLYKCGDRISAQLIIKNLEGEIIFNSSEANKPISFIIGDNKIPFAIMKIAEGIGANGSRTAIIPAESLKTLDNKRSNLFPSSIKLPEKEMLIVEFSAI